LAERVYDEGIPDPTTSHPRCPPRRPNHLQGRQDNVNAHRQVEIGDAKVIDTRKNRSLLRMLHIDPSELPEFLSN